MHQNAIAKRPAMRVSFFASGILTRHDVDTFIHDGYGVSGFDVYDTCSRLAW